MKRFTKDQYRFVKARVGYLTRLGHSPSEIETLFLADDFKRPDGSTISARYIRIVIAKMNKPDKVESNFTPRMRAASILIGLAAFWALFRYLSA